MYGWIYIFLFSSGAFIHSTVLAELNDSSKAQIHLILSDSRLITFGLPLRHLIIRLQAMMIRNSSNGSSSSSATSSAMSLKNNKATTTTNNGSGRLFNRAVIIVSFSILAIFTCCHLAMKVSFWYPTTRSATSSVSFKDLNHQSHHIHPRDNVSIGGSTVTKTLSNSYNDDADTTDTRPLAIIHIGPRKCATTNIQYVLGHETTRELLKQDNFVYLGKGPGLKTGDQALQKKMGTYIRDCLWKSRKCTNETTNLWIEFVQSIQTFRKNGQNIIISDEAIPHVVTKSQDIQQMIDAFDGYNIRIVMSYRRYYEWIISEYNQQYKESYAHIIQPFVTWYRQQQVPKLRSEVYAPPDKELMERCKPYVDEVRVFNMHDGLGNGDLIERFVCDMIPEAKHTCNVATRGHNGLPVAPLDRQKVSVTTIDSQYIAEQIYLTKKYQAMNKGEKKHKQTSMNAMMKMMSREEIISFKKDVMASGISNRIQDDIDRHDNNQDNDQLSQHQRQNQHQRQQDLDQHKLPRLCLTEQEQEELLQRTIQIEKDVLPDFFYYSTTTSGRSTSNNTRTIQEEGASSIRGNFEKSVVNSNKYCTIDAQTLLLQQQTYYPTTTTTNTWYEKYASSFLFLE